MNWPIFLAGTVSSTLLILACDRKAPGPCQASSVPQGPPLSLRQTYDRLRDWHAKHSYLAMLPHMDPDSRDEVIDLLMAMDELLAANAGAQLAISKACPGIEAERFDLAAQLADSLELFSTHIEFISDRRDGDRGTVTVQIAGRVPLTHINFRRRAGHWVYLPGPVGRDLIPITRAITGALNRIALVVSAGPRTREEIEAEYRLRIGRKLKRIGQLTAPGSQQK